MLLVLLIVCLTLPCAVWAERLPAGKSLEARMMTPTGSRISREGDRVQATIIAPTIVNGRLVVPQGATIWGVVDKVERLGLGLKHITASISYRFDLLHLPDGTTVPIQTRLAEVETAKERVDTNGSVGGIYPEANISSTVSYYLVPLLCLDPVLGAPVMGLKFLIARSPDPEIYFPEGTEIIVHTTSPVEIPTGVVTRPGIEPLSEAD